MKLVQIDRMSYAGVNGLFSQTSANSIHRHEG